MAAVLTGYAETGLTTAKVVRRRLSDGAYWSTVTPGWEAYSGANVANYGIAATEVAAGTGVYTTADPDPATPGDYLLVKAAGSNLAAADLSLGLRWQDDTGPSRTQAFPTNFAALGITAAGKVSEVVLVDTLAAGVNVTQVAGQTANAAGPVTFPGTVAAIGDAMTLTVGERNATADAHLDRTNAIETGVTPRQAERLILSGIAGKSSGFTTGAGTGMFRNAVADSKPRITAVVDGNGNRTAITWDVT